MDFTGISNINGTIVQTPVEIPLDDEHCIMLTWTYNEHCTNPNLIGKHGYTYIPFSNYVLNYGTYEEKP